MKLQLIIFLMLFNINKQQLMPTSDKTKNYACEKVGNLNNNYIDYISLSFSGDTISEGLYYGNTADYHFMARIVFVESNKGEISFYLDDYRFSAEMISPFKEPVFYKRKIVPIELDGRNEYWGEINLKSLILKRVLWIYDSKFDKMTFTIIEY